MHVRTNRFGIVLAGLAWLLVVVGGFRELFAHQAEPGPAARAPTFWPAEAGIERVGDRPLLLLFAHPQCPCTPASLRELERLLACVPSLSAAVVVWTPSAERADFARGALLERARAVEGVRIVLDPEGALARRFGARTSGQALLYASDGALLFAGGITPARGHQGDSSGAEAVAALARGQPSACRTSPVFGCGLEARR